LLGAIWADIILNLSLEFSSMHTALKSLLRVISRACSDLWARRPTPPWEDEVFLEISKWKFEYVFLVKI